MIDDPVLQRESAYAFPLADQTSNVPGGTNVVLHAEVPTWDWLRFFASLYRVNLAAFGETSSNSISKLLTEDNTLVFAGARAKILPVLFVNAQYVRAWMLDQTGTTNSYQINNSLQVNLEGGFEFSMH